jgi:hypothetical protein
MATSVTSPKTLLLKYIKKIEFMFLDSWMPLEMQQAPKWALFDSKIAVVPTVKEILS